MDFSAVSSYFKQLAQEITLYNQHAAMVASLDGLALIKRRVISSGVNSEGKKFKPYSDALISKKNQESRTGSGKSIKKLKDLASYKEIRRANNLQVNHRDFKFTGRMWGNIKPIVNRKSKGFILITINADQPDLKKRVEKNNAIIKDNFLRPSASDLEEIRATYQQEFLNRILK